MRVGGTIRGFRREDEPEYPYQALREAIVNAVVHPTQTLLTWLGAAVVVDPKGEQWQRTASWRASNIGPVYCLPSAGIDLLDYFSLGDPLDTQELHQHLIRPWQDKDPVFAEKCLALFTAAAQVAAATESHALRVLAGWADQRAPIALQAAYPHA